MLSLGVNPSLWYKAEATAVLSRYAGILSSPHLSRAHFISMDAAPRRWWWGCVAMNARPSVL